ncbi:unnamed protein product [Linum trigynum]|uniref:Uncharacterized protein n=1 Tax=Linum trigynum TaxID=586398 RepID=A0AAV2D4U4_9ROSI
MGGFFQARPRPCAGQTHSTGPQLFGGLISHNPLNREFGGRSDLGFDVGLIIAGGADPLGLQSGPHKNRHAQEYLVTGWRIKPLTSISLKRESTT